MLLISRSRQNLSIKLIGSPISPNHSIMKLLKKLRKLSHVFWTKLKMLMNRLVLDKYMMPKRRSKKKKSRRVSSNQFH